MINPAFVRVLAASADDRRGLFVAAARRLGITERIAEKDFWVCWTLDAMFNRRPAGAPRLLFKGGTSLSKVFNLIARFSEDLDITVFRDDIGHAVSIETLEELSGKRRQARLDAIRDACREYICGPLHANLVAVADLASQEAGLPPGSIGIVVDEADPDRQTLLLWYPSVTAEAEGYVRPAVRIESGAKSALNPHVPAIIVPYVAEDLRSADLAISNITTIEAGRTFWDKVIILHGLRQWFDRRGVLLQGGQRVSRHYYDVHRFVTSDIGRAAETEITMAIDCARHARAFFGRRDQDLDSAVAGRFTLAPSPGMVEALRADYANMIGMIFGTPPDFNAVIESVTSLEGRINTLAAGLRQPSTS